MDIKNETLTTEEKMKFRMRRREYMAIRTLTAVIVTLFVFWCGFEFGEIRASIGMMHSYGDERMMQSNWVHPVTSGVMMPMTATAPQQVTTQSAQTAPNTTK